jgi:hypothetical protein
VSPEPQRPVRPEEELRPSVPERVSIIGTLVTLDRQEVRSHQNTLLKLSYLFGPTFIGVVVFFKKGSYSPSEPIASIVALLVLYIVLFLVTFLLFLRDTRAALNIREEFYRDSSRLFYQAEFVPLQPIADKHRKYNFMDGYLLFSFFVTLIIGFLCIGYVWNDCNGSIPPSVVSFFAGLLAGSMAGAVIATVIKWAQRKTEEGSPAKGVLAKKKAIEGAAELAGQQGAAQGWTQPCTLCIPEANLTLLFENVAVSLPTSCQLKNAFDRLWRTARSRLLRDKAKASPPRVIWRRVPSVILARVDIRTT